MASPTITVGFTAATGGFNRGIGDAQRKLSGFDKGARAASFGLGSLAKGFALLGGLSLAKGLFTDSIAEAREAQKTLANTQAVIKATGGAAGVTAKDVDKLATALSNKTGIDDEAVASGANLLLTFKNVKKEGGIFDRATASALDLSAAGFGSVESASKTLGKALNDPLKGVSALSKQGVTFSDVQKEQIANFVKTGNVAKAQNLILKEVESQVGGQAAAQATAGEKLAVTIGNIKEQIGTALLPVLDRMATYLAANLPQWIATAGAAFTRFKAFITPVIETVRSFFGGLDSGSGTASAKFAQFQATATTVFTAVRSVISSTVTIVTALWQRFGGILTTYATNSLTNVLNVVRGAFTVIQGLFNVVAGVLTGDWSRVWKGLKGIASGALTAVKAVVSQGINAAVTVMRVALSALKGIVSGAFNGLKGAASAGVSALVGFVKGIPGKIKSGLGNLGTLLLSAGGDIVAGLAQGIRDKASDAINAAKNLADNVKGAVKGALSIFSPSRVMREFGRFVSQGLALGIIDRKGDVLKSTQDLAALINETLPKNIKKPKAIAKWYDEHDKAVKKGSKTVLNSLRAAARERTNALIQASNEYADAVKNSALQYASLTNLQLGENENLSADGIAQYFRDRLSNIRNFNAKLAQLKTKGISQGLYDQIVQMGVENGTGYAEALATASPAAFAEINNLQAQIGVSASNLGNSTAANMYGAGIAAAQGFENGLNTLIAKVEKSAKNISKKLIKALKKALGIKSPSRKMMAISDQVVAGMLKPLDERVLATRGVELANAFAAGYANSGPATAYVAPKQTELSPLALNNSGGGTTVIENVNVMVDSKMSPVQYGQEIDKALTAAKKVGAVR